MFVQHVAIVGKWLALWMYFKRANEIKTLPSPILAVYFEQYLHTWGNSRH